METPYSKAWNKWIKSLEGIGCANVDTLTKPDSAGHPFLENRLHLAFANAWVVRGQWIAVADELPEQGTIVWTCNMKVRELVDCFRVAWLAEHSWRTSVFAEDLPEPTHWLPISDAPTGGS